MTKKKNKKVFFFIAVRDCLSMSHDLYIHVFAFYLEDLMWNEQWWSFAFVVCCILSRDYFYDEVFPLELKMMIVIGIAIWQWNDKKDLEDEWLFGWFCDLKLTWMIGIALI